MPNTPAIAPGTKEATALNASIMAESNPTPTMPFSRTFTSIPLSASTIPEKKAMRTSIATFMSSGRFFAIPSRTLIKNWKIESTIEGVYLTRATNTASISASAPSAICGTHSKRTSSKDRTTALMASPIAGALSAITRQNAIIPSPIFSSTAGISAATPVMITVRDATIAVAPAAPAAAKAVNPTAKADNPVPAANSPAPIARTPTPMSAKAPLNPRIVGTSGVRTAPATPRTAKAPAIVTNPFAMEIQLIAPRTERTGVNTAKAAAATSIAAEPPSVPFIKFSPTASSANATPIVTSPLAICSHEKLPIFPRTFATISRAAPTITKPVPIPTMFLGISFVAIATSAKAPPIETNPLAICSHENFAKSDIAEANIFIAAAISISARPEETTCFAFPVRLVNAATSRRSAPTAARPLPISSHFISPKSLQTDARIFIAAARITIPVAVVIALPPNLAVFKNKSTSASRTPTPTRPFANCSHCSFARSLTTEARTLIAAERISIPVAVEVAPLLNFAVAIKASNSASRTPTPTRPAVSCFQLKSASFFTALERIRTAPANTINFVEPFPVTPSSLLNTAIAPIKFANITVIAPSDAESFSLSINEIATIEAAKIAIAVAILINAPAFNCV